MFGVGVALGLGLLQGLGRVNLQQAHIAASALLVVFAPDKQQQAARQRYRSAHKVLVRVKGRARVRRLGLGL